MFQTYFEQVAPLQTKKKNTDVLMLLKQFMLSGGMNLIMMLSVAPLSISKCVCNRFLQFSHFLHFHFLFSLVAARHFPGSYPTDVSIGLTFYTLEQLHVCTNNIRLGKHFSPLKSPEVPVTFSYM